MKNNKIISKNTKVRVTLDAEVKTLLLAANRGDFIVEIRPPKRESNVVKIRHVTTLPCFSGAGQIQTLMRAKFKHGIVIQDSK